jgi:HlyD family secretion protein
MRALKSRRSLYYIVPAVVVVVVVAAVALFGATRTAGAQAESQSVQTSVARTGSLELSASGTGSLIAKSEVQLGFGTSGELKEVLVHVGDTVKAGDVLARLDDTTAREGLAQAQMNLRELTSPRAIAEAQIAVADAQDALKTAQYNYTVQQAGNRATQDTIEGAKARLAQAKTKLQEAQNAYDHASDTEKANAYDRYASAKSSYNSALATYNWYTGHPTDIQQSQLEANVALAQAQVDEAQALLTALTGGDLPAGASGSGLTALQDARKAVDEAQATLDATELQSPSDGTVTAIDATVGETVGSSPVFTLMDLSQPYLEFYMDETDIDKVAVGETVNATFDAYPNTTFTGKVVSVDPALVSSGGVSAVHGTAELDPQAGDKPPRLLVGQSASVDVIAASVDQAVLVPVEAVREISPGQYAVFVVDSSGGLTLRMVEVGLQNDVFAAITSGLQSGETVSTGIVQAGS